MRGVVGGFAGPVCSVFSGVRAAAWLVCAFGLLLAPQHTHAWSIAREVRSALERPSGVPAPELPPARSFDACPEHFPARSPISVADIAPELRVRQLCFDRFAVVYSAATKTPLLVVERLTADVLAAAAGGARTDEFFVDPRLAPGERASLEDFSGSGFDRGHMAPAANMTGTRAMAQSFVLTNIVPQDSFNNRKVWSKVESDTRHFARRAKGAVYVFTGPIFLDTPRTIGRGRVWVPHELFKLVYDEASGRAWAHVLPNTAEAKLGPPMSYREFVARSGWDPLAGRLGVAR